MQALSSRFACASWQSKGHTRKAPRLVRSHLWVPRSGCNCQRSLQIYYRCCKGSKCKWISDKSCTVLIHSSARMIYNMLVRSILKERDSRRAQDKTQRLPFWSRRPASLKRGAIRGGVINSAVLPQKREVYQRALPVRTAIIWHLQNFESLTMNPGYRLYSNQQPPYAPQN